ncbi:hypothetical protein B0H66DRAFT_65783 [Apodospora peruviana]|uniref:Uncharacterized protein n=1 Tax=Apodospora peruviana TaxID=516989 RepID=A0AAE0MFN4_9PEZI|nr:hypothetical protein B0H66DRAFT_65783 [Apodospora peruviana]
MFVLSIITVARIWLLLCFTLPTSQQIFTFKWFVSLVLGLNLNKEVVELQSRAPFLAHPRAISRCDVILKQSPIFYL